MIVQVYETDAIELSIDDLPDIKSEKQLKVFCTISKLPNINSCFKCHYFESFDPDKMEITCNFLEK